MPARSADHQEPDEEGQERDRDDHGHEDGEMRSANRWTGALEPCASSTSFTIWARAVSLPTLVRGT